MSDENWWDNQKCDGDTIAAMCQQICDLRNDRSGGDSRALQAKRWQRELFLYRKLHHTLGLAIGCQIEHVQIACAMALMRGGVLRPDEEVGERMLPDYLNEKFMGKDY